MISLSCDYCGAPFITAAPSQNQSLSDFRAQWKLLAQRAPVCECVGCHGSFAIADDGNPDGLVSLANVSRPKIDSISIGVGSRSGGTALFLQGQALDIGDLVVKFGGAVCPTVDQRTSTTARVVTPPGVYALSLAEQCHRLTLTPVVNTLVVDEAVTTAAGSTGVIRLIEDSICWVYFANLAESLEDMVGVNLLGSSSGGVSTVNAIEFPSFSDGEFVYGISSAAQGTLRLTYPLLVDAPSNNFVPFEVFKGGASQAVARLGNPAYSGLVDVSVENEYGQREFGGALLGGFTYA